MSDTPPMMQDPVRQGQPAPDDPFRYASPEFTFGPPTAKQAEDDIFSAMGEVGSYDSQQARGVWENLKWQGAATAKTIGDSFVNVASLLHKTGSGAISAVQGEGFGAGWDAVREHYRNLYGTTDPSILDLGASFGYYGDKGIYKSLGEQQDREITRRLGESEMFGRALGGVVSFAIPGGPIGRASTVASKPIGRVAERVLERAALKAANVSDDAARTLLQQGRGLEFLARNPGMNTALSTTLATAGRTAEQIATTTGAFVAQAYAISPDSERAKAAQHSAMIAPFMLPIAQLGERLGQAASQFGLSAQKTEALRGIYTRFEAGEINYGQLTESISQTMGLPRRMAANLVAAPFESSAFMALDHQSWDLLKQGLSGDADAWANLQMMWLGTTAGIVATKGLVPHDAAAFWKSYRPDANRLQTYLEANRNQRIAQELQAERQQPNVNEQINREGEQIEADRELARSQRQDEQAANVRAETDRFRNIPSVEQDPVARQYAWADGPTRAVLRGQWEPSFQPQSEPGAVFLTFNGENSVRLTQRGEGVELMVTEGTMSLLRNVNRAPNRDSSNYEVTGPDQITLRGPEARQALDDLALLGALRVMQGERNFGRLGYQEVSPGIWRDPQTNIDYRVRLNGEVQARESLDAAWRNSEAIHTFGESPVLFDNAALNAAGEWLISKQQLAPNTLIDTIFGEAITLAREGNGRTAQEMRSLFEALDADPTALRDFMDQLNPAEDSLVALELGSIGAGTENATSVFSRMRADAEMRAGAEQEILAAEREQYRSLLLGEGELVISEEVRVNMNRRVAERKEAERKREQDEYQAALEEGVERAAPPPKPESPPIPSAGEEMLRRGSERMQQLREQVRKRRVVREANRQAAEAEQAGQFEAAMREFAMGQRRDRPATEQEISDWLAQNRDRMEQRRLEQESLSEAELQSIRDEMRRGEEMEAERQIQEAELSQDQQRALAEQRRASEAERQAALEAQNADKASNLQKRYTRQDEMRESVAASVERANISGTVTAKLSAERALGLMRFARKDSAFMRRLREIVESNGVGTVDVQAAEFQEFVKTYAKFAGRQRSRYEADPEVAYRRLQSTDEFVRSVAEQFRAQIPERSMGETFAARMRLQEDTARAVFGVGGPETMSAQRVRGPQRGPTEGSQEPLGVRDYGFEGVREPTRREQGTQSRREIELRRAEETIREELQREEQETQAEMEAMAEEPMVEVTQPTEAESAPVPEVARPEQQVAKSKDVPRLELPDTDVGFPAIPKGLDGGPKKWKSINMTKQANAAISRDYWLRRGSKADADAFLDQMEPIGSKGRWTAEQKLNRYYEILAWVKKNQPKSKGKGKKPSTGEEGFVDIGALADAFVGAGEAVIRSARRIFQQARTGSVALAARKVLRTQNQMARSVLQNIDPTLADALRRTRTGVTPQITGEAKSRLRPAREALRQLESDWARNRSAVDRLMGRNRWQDQMVDIGNDMQRARWEMLVDGRIQPANAMERQFVDGMQASLQYLHSEAVAAGKTRYEFDPATNEMQLVPLRSRSQSVVPFSRGRDLDTILGNDALRQDWFNDLAAANPQVQVRWYDQATQQNRTRPITGRDLEVEFQQANRQRQLMEFSDSAEALSALDYTRRFTNMGHWWRGYEVRSNDVMPLMEQQINKQGTGIAVARTFGEDHSDAARQAFIANYQNDPGAVAAIDMMANRFGLQRRVQAAAQRISNMGPQSVNELYQKAIIDYAARVAGKEPNPAPWIVRMMTVGRAGEAVETVGRAVTIWKSFVLDIPEFATQPLVYGQWRDLGRGLSMMLSARPGQTRRQRMEEAVNLIKQEGLVEDFMGNHIFAESAQVGQRLAEMVSIPGSLTETGKQTLYAFNAKARLERWGRGEATDFDTRVLRDVMQYPDADVQALTTGQADPVLRTQFQRDYVQLLSSRRGQGEGPAFADSPTANKLFRYVRWATNRTANTITAARNVYNSLEAVRANPSDQMARRDLYDNLRMAGRITLGAAVAGNIGSMLAYAFADMIRGENGFARWGREFMSAPVSTVIKSASAQLIGGPIAQIGMAAMREDPRRAVQMVAPANMAYAIGSNIGEVASAWSSGDVTKAIRKTRDFAYSVAEDLGTIPAADIRSVMSWFTGRDQRNMDLRAREFGRNEDIKHPMGNRYRPEEYYDAIKMMVSAARNSDLSKEFLAQAADPKLRKKLESQGVSLSGASTYYEALKQALSIAPGESVASSIEGHQRMRHWTNEQRSKFIDIHGEQAFNEMAQADQSLRDLAKIVRRYEGTAPTAWESELESVARQASLGATDRWSQLTERTINEAALRYRAGDGFGDQLERLSVEMAARPETLGSVFQDDTMKRILSSPSDSMSLSRLIYAKLLKRAMSQVKDDIRTEAKESNRVQ